MQLVIDTCGPDLRIFLFVGTHFFKSVDHDFLRKSDVLSERVETLLKQANKTAQNLTDIAVAIGPGSFIGTRAGVLFAKTLAQVLDTKFWTAESSVVEPVFQSLASAKSASWNDLKKHFTLVPSAEIALVQELYAKSPTIGGK